MSEASDTTNPEVGDEEPVVAPEGVVEGQEAQGDDQEQSDEDTGDDAGATDEDLEEIELEGKKYLIPKAIQAERMMHKAFTQKTQEVADLRKAAEARQAAIAEREAAIPSLIAEHATIHTLEQQLKQYDDYNWQAAEIAANRIEDDQEREATLAQLRAHERAYNALPRQIAAAKEGLSKKESERLEEQRSATAKALQETGEVLSRDIPGWGPELVNKLVGAAEKIYGVPLAELREIADPRLWKVLHDAHRFHDLQAKQKTAQTITKQAAVKPAVTTKGGSFTGAGVHDNLPAGEWVRRRNAEVAKKRTG